MLFSGLSSCWEDSVRSRGLRICRNYVQYKLIGQSMRLVAAEFFRSVAQFQCQCRVLSHANSVCSYLSPPLCALSEYLQFHAYNTLVYVQCTRASTGFLISTMYRRTETTSAPIISIVLNRRLLCFCVRIVLKKMRCV